MGRTFLRNLPHSKDANQLPVSSSSNAQARPMQAVVVFLFLVGLCFLAHGLFFNGPLFQTNPAHRRLLLTEDQRLVLQTSIASLEELLRETHHSLPQIHHLQRQIQAHFARFSPPNVHEPLYRAYHELRRSFTRLEARIAQIEGPHQYEDYLAYITEHHLTTEVEVEEEEPEYNYLPNEPQYFRAPISPERRKFFQMPLPEFTIPEAPVAPAVPAVPETVPLRLQMPPLPPLPLPVRPALFATTSSLQRELGENCRLLMERVPGRLEKVDELLTIYGESEDVAFEVILRILKELFDEYVQLAYNLLEVHSCLVVLEEDAHLTEAEFAMKAEAIRLHNLMAKVHAKVNPYLAHLFASEILTKDSTFQLSLMPKSWDKFFSPEMKAVCRHLPTMGFLVQESFENTHLRFVVEAHRPHLKSECEAILRRIQKMLHEIETDGGLLMESGPRLNRQEKDFIEAVKLSYEAFSKLFQVFFKAKLATAIVKVEPAVVPPPVEPPRQPLAEYPPEKGENRRLWEQMTRFVRHLEAEFAAYEEVAGKELASGVSPRRKGVREIGCDYFEQLERIQEHLREKATAVVNFQRHVTGPEQHFWQEVFDSAQALDGKVRRALGLLKTKCDRLRQGPFGLPLLGRIRPLSAEIREQLRSMASRLERVPPDSRTPKFQACLKAVKALAAFEFDCSRQRDLLEALEKVSRLVFLFEESQLLCGEATAASRGFPAQQDTLEKVVDALRRTHGHSLDSYLSLLRPKLFPIHSPVTSVLYLPLFDLKPMRRKAFTRERMPGYAAVSRLPDLQELLTIEMLVGDLANAVAGLRESQFELGLGVEEYLLKSKSLSGEALVLETLLNSHLENVLFLSSLDPADEAAVIAGICALKVELAEIRLSLFKTNRRAADQHRFSLDSRPAILLDERELDLDWMTGHSPVGQINLLKGFRSYFVRDVARLLSSPELLEADLRLTFARVYFMFAVDLRVFEFSLEEDEWTAHNFFEMFRGVPAEITEMNLISRLKWSGVNLAQAYELIQAALVRLHESKGNLHELKLIVLMETLCRRGLLAIKAAVEEIQEHRESLETDILLQDSFFITDERALKGKFVQWLESPFLDELKPRLAQVKHLNSIINIADSAISLKLQDMTSEELEAQALKLLAAHDQLVAILEAVDPALASVLKALLAMIASALVRCSQAYESRIAKAFRLTREPLVQLSQIGEEYSQMSEIINERRLSQEDQRLLRITVFALEKAISLHLASVEKALRLKPPPEHSVCRFFIHRLRQATAEVHTLTRLTPLQEAYDKVVYYYYGLVRHCDADDTSSYVTEEYPHYRLSLVGPTEIKFPPDPTRLDLHRGLDRLMRVAFSEANLVYVHSHAEEFYTVQVTDTALFAIQAFTGFIPDHHRFDGKEIMKTAEALLADFSRMADELAADPQKFVGPLFPADKEKVVASIAVYAEHCQGYALASKVVVAVLEEDERELQQQAYYYLTRLQVLIAMLRQKMLDILRPDPGQPFPEAQQQVAILHVDIESQEAYFPRPDPRVRQFYAHWVHIPHFMLSHYLSICLRQTYAVLAQLNESPHRVSSVDMIEHLLTLLDRLRQCDGALLAAESLILQLPECQAEQEVLGMALEQTHFNFLLRRQAENQLYLYKQSFSLLQRLPDFQPFVVRPELGAIMEEWHSTPALTAAQEVGLTSFFSSIHVFLAELEEVARKKTLPEQAFMESLFEIEEGCLSLSEFHEDFASAGHRRALFKIIDLCAELMVWTADLLASVLPEEPEMRIEHPHFIFKANPVKAGVRHPFHKPPQLPYPAEWYEAEKLEEHPEENETARTPSPSPSPRPSPPPPPPPRVMMNKPEAVFPEIAPAQDELRVTAPAFYAASGHYQNTRPALLAFLTARDQEERARLRTELMAAKGEFESSEGGLLAEANALWEESRQAAEGEQRQVLRRLVQRIDRMRELVAKAISLIEEEAQQGQFSL